MADPTRVSPLDPAFHSQILRHVSDAVISIDNDGRVTYLNPSAEQQYHVAATDAVGRPLRDLYEYRWVDPTDEARSIAALGREGYWRGENLHILRDGTVLHVDSTVSVLTDDANRQIGLLAVIRNVTSEKRAAAVQQQLEERARIALDVAELGTWKHDIPTGQVELDARARAHYGINAQVVGIDEILARVHPEDLPGVRRTIVAAIDPRVKAAVNLEYCVVRPQAGTRWLSISGTVRFEVVDGTERAVVAIGTTRDVTEHRRTQERLHDADRRKDEFLAILAHELRNPLAPIRTAVGILRARNVPEALQVRARDIIDRQVAHMARLVDDLLDVSRLSRGQISLQRAAVSLDEVLDAAVETARPLVEDRRHTLTEHRTDRSIALDADLARLSQVFANLLNNAAKYTPPGGAIAVDVADGPGYVEIRVTDTGEGIAPDQLERIFGLFAQGGGSSGSSAGGLGIGLALARKLVELHGGVITVESAGPGCGTTFTVTLPTVDDVGAMEASAAQSSVVPATRGRRVLVVDDNIDAADATSLLLQEAGCVVRTAYDGEHALRELASFAADVVLLDLGMPGVDGVEVCRRIRALPAGASIRVIAVTGWGQEESRRRTTMAGFDEHLVKPVSADALLQVVFETRG
jgi:PAS domain S-box-containing protein